MKLKFYLFSLCLGSIMGLGAQDLKKHQWINRVILIISNDSKSQIYNNQIQEFKGISQEFKVRKLLTFYVLPSTYKLGNDKGNSWIDGSELYTKYNTSGSNFKVILIGLDGRIKIEQNDVLNTKELFLTIDGMPMRRAELKKQRP